ncbi:MAG TPA: four helix bundle protein [Vicinamibacterales bacterium]|nr:four helix bundle protein [Vicinamibacterales bacterium]
MIARTLEDLVVYRKAVDACDAVSAVLERPKVRADRDLREQLAAASAAAPANIAERFGQQSDRQFARPTADC